MAEAIRILHVFGAMNLGGAESRIMDLYRAIDKTRVQFDFLVHTDKDCYFDKEILEMGGRIFRVPPFRVYNLFAYRCALRNIFKDHPEFHMVHGHMTSTAGIYLPIAKKAGIQTTIAHARSAGVDKGVKGWITRLLRLGLRRKADVLFTCSELAAISVFGKKAYQKGMVQFVPNAIDAEKYRYNREVRQQVREELQIQDRFVIGHVGSFRYAKNHEFLLKVFSEILRMNESMEDNKKPVLLLLGDGERMDEMKAEAVGLEIADQTLFLGNRNDAWRYYQAFDYVIFPSRYEGMPGTIIEAQAAGLRCLISDRISGDVVFTDLVSRKSIDEDPMEWAKTVMEQAQFDRKDYYTQTKQAGFDIKGQAEKMLNFYTSKYKKILLLIPALHQGGMEKVCVMTADILEKHCQVYLAMFTEKNIFYKPQDTELINLDLGVRKSRLGKVINVLRRVLQVRKLKKQKKIDITISFGSTASLVNVLAHCKDQVISAIHGYNLLKEKPKMLAISKWSDTVLCCSEMISEEFKRRYPSRNVLTLYNPYDVDSIAKKSFDEIAPEHRTFFNSTDKTLATMSREDDLKGFWHLIKIFALLNKKMMGVRLVIIGDGDFSEYKKLAEKLGVKERVLFTGLQQNPFAYLRLCDVYVMTSISEGLPNGLIEAMAVGLPVISTNCMTGPAEILHTDYHEAVMQQGVFQADFGILMPQLSPNKNLNSEEFDENEQIFADELYRLLNQEQELARRREQSLQRSGFFRAERYEENLLRILDNL